MDYDSYVLISGILQIIIAGLTCCWIYKTYRLQERITRINENMFARDDGKLEIVLRITGPNDGERVQIRMFNSGKRPVRLMRFFVKKKNSELVCLSPADQKIIKRLSLDEAHLEDFLASDFTTDKGEPLGDVVRKSLGKQGYYDLEDQINKKELDFWAEDHASREWRLSKIMVFPLGMV